MPTICSSVTLAAESARLTVAICPAVTVTDWSVGVYPMRAVCRRCAPAGTSLIEYRPSGPVRAPSWVPGIVTATLAMGAPATRSVTVPVIRPAVPCAPAIPAASATSRARAGTAARRRRTCVQCMRRSPLRAWSLEFTASRLRWRAGLRILFFIRTNEIGTCRRSPTVRVRRVRGKACATAPDPRVPSMNAPTPTVSHIRRAARANICSSPELFHPNLRRSGLVRQRPPRARRNPPPPRPHPTRGGHCCPDPPSRVYRATSVCRAAAIYPSPALAPKRSTLDLAPPPAPAHVPPRPHMSAVPIPNASERIGDLLYREGLITADQLAKALQEQKQSGTRVGYNLVKLGFIAEVELTKVLAKQHKMPAVDLTGFEPDAKLVKLVPSEMAQKHFLLPLQREGRTLTIAIVDPSNLGFLEDLKFITRCDIYPVLAGEFTLRGLIDRTYGPTEESQMASLMDTIEELEGELSDDVEVVAEEEEDVNQAAMQAQMEDAPVVKLINAILTDAVKRGASDIHFECFEHELRVRYRIDGALQEVMKPPMKLKAALISRFKIMSQLNIAERRVPQDGRIKLKMGKKVIDYRVSTLPTLFGEKVVLRILDKGNLTFDLEKFGIEPRAEKDFMEAVSNPYGMVLVTGPTGSGKTTTLYSALSKVNLIDVNIMTAEDPVEYNLFGINQVLVRNEI